MSKPQSPCPPHEAHTTRLPYEPPAIEESSEFETLALACGKEPFSVCEYYGETANS